MKIQVGHSRDFDYQNELYTPLREISSGEIKWIFPHDVYSSCIKSEDSLKKVDLFLAEVSYKATGLGIELGFAYLYKKPIICIYRKGIKFSSSLYYICKDFIEYNDREDLKIKLQKYFKT